jgi:uncharacterized protein YecE (DUF72 family)
VAQGLSYLGCAGWSLPRDAQAFFAAGDSHLQRYASRLNGVEINSSFHRPHSRATYARWAGAVPQDFRFCVKLPKTITHVNKLAGSEPLLDEFLEQAGGLGERLGCLLVQLPPRLAFDHGTATAFFDALQQRHAGALALEPRHASWFDSEVDAWLAGRQVSRVLADPVRFDAGRVPGGFARRIYLRLHGSPRMYYSSYEADLLAAVARRIAAAVREGVEAWCMFDNTAGSAAAHNAVELKQALDKELE